MKRLRVALILYEKVIVFVTHKNIARAFLFACLLFTCLGNIAPAFSQAARQDINLDQHWQFLRDDAPGAETVTYDDTAWQAIDLPHTWNAQDGEAGITEYYRGPGWYRRHLLLDANWTGKSLFLKFDGASLVTDVYVNGQSIGQHRGAFGAFCFDVTAALHPGADNVIAVRVDNSYTPEVAPLDGDFTLFGGLYRDVHLLILNPISIDPTDYASPGVYLTQKNVSQSAATVAILAKIRNASSNPKPVTLHWTLADKDGHLVLAKTSALIAAANGTTDATQSLTLPTPHLWDGVNDPYLYQVTVQVEADGIITDSVQQPLGLRFFRVDPTLGLFLNGKHYALHGVNRHQDRLHKGWAISQADTQQDFALIKELGCTGIRLSHYQHAQGMYDLCDQNGVVVWAELPLVDYIGLSDAFSQNAHSQLTELIKQNYNHPAIFFWSLFNELTTPRSKTQQAQQLALITSLNTLAHSLDPTRLTVAATNQAVDNPLNFITDVIAFNWYYGWYYGSANDFAKKLDAAHLKYPKRCIAMSEYGAGASIYEHEDHAKQPEFTDDAWHPEEYQSAFHEKAWAEFQARPYLWGTFLWCMFDFASNGRDEGDTAGRNDKGLVTYDRAVKKDAFYWYLANWTTKPLVYITDRRYTLRPSSPVTVKIYSNCDTVELTINGQSLGQKPVTNHIAKWLLVALKAGDNQIHATGIKDAQTVSDACVWTYDLPAITPASPSP